MVEFQPAGGGFDRGGSGADPLLIPAAGAGHRDAAVVPPTAQIGRFGQIDMVAASGIARPVQQAVPAADPARKQRRILVARRQDQFGGAEAAPVAGAAAADRDSGRSDRREGDQVFAVNLLDAGVLDAIGFAGLFRHQAAAVVRSEGAAAVVAPRDQEVGHRGQQETAVPHQTARAGTADAGIVLAHPDHGDRPVFRQDRRGQKARFRDGTLGDAQQQPDSPSEPERTGIENTGDFKIRPRRRKIAGRQQRISDETIDGDIHMENFRIWIIKA